MTLYVKLNVVVTMHIDDNTCHVFQGSAAAATFTGHTLLIRVTTHPIQHKHIPSIDRITLNVHCRMATTQNGSASTAPVLFR